MAYCLNYQKQNKDDFESKTLGLFSTVTLAHSVMKALYQRQFEKIAASVVDQPLDDLILSDICCANAAHIETGTDCYYWNIEELPVIFTMEIADELVKQIIQEESEKGNFQTTDENED